MPLFHFDDFSPPFSFLKLFKREKGLVWDYLKEVSGAEMGENRHAQVLREEVFLSTVILPLQELFSADLALFFYPFHIRLCDRPEQERQDGKSKIVVALSGSKKHCAENS